tara:strand:+ start:42 stop:605 length:564 start_codon:yes stop_codon:yes gene_type:complete
MAVNNLKGQNIQDTYQRVVQTDGASVADGTGSLLPISFDGNNVIISGSLTATEYSVTSSVTNVVFQQQSGSTIFGDSQDDTHLFTGSLDVLGSITSSNNVKARSFIASSGDDAEFLTVHIGGAARGVIANGTGGGFGLMISTNHLEQTTILGEKTIQLGTNSTTHVTASGNIKASGELIGNIDGGKF